MHSSFWVTNQLRCTSLFTSGVDDLYDVKKELNTVSAKWYDIGIALRLDPNILTGIQTKSGDPSTCLCSVLTEWLKWNYKVKKFGEPTWRWVVDAVGDPAGGAHMALARDIARRHKPRTASGGCAIVTPPGIISKFRVSVQKIIQFGCDPSISSNDTDCESNSISSPHFLAIRSWHMVFVHLPTFTFKLNCLFSNFLAYLN